MDLASNVALGSTAAPQDAGLRAAAFEFGIEPTLLLDPHADLVLDANPAACTLLGYDRALLRQTRVSALHTGQLPALIVFTQAVLDKGAYWTNALTPRHATGQSLRLEYAGTLLPGDGRSLVLLTMGQPGVQYCTGADWVWAGRPPRHSSANTNAKPNLLVKIDIRATTKCPETIPCRSRERQSALLAVA